MGHRILIVEDEATVSFAMAEYFGALGYTVDCVGDKAEAERLLGKEDMYDVVIADLRLSGNGSTEGLDIVESLRGRTRSIVLTAFGSPEIAVRARELGADVFLNKPQRLSTIAEIISKLIGEA